MAGQLVGTSESPLAFRIVTCVRFFSCNETKLFNVLVAFMSYKKECSNGESESGLMLKGFYPGYEASTSSK